MGDRPIPCQDRQAKRHRQRPNREDDPQYIIKLLGKVIAVSLETIEIVERLPELNAPIQLTLCQLPAKIEQAVVRQLFVVCLSQIICHSEKAGIPDSRLNWDIA